MSLLKKSANILALSLLLLFPLGQIEDLARDRQHLQQQVIQDIAQTASGEQRLLGPVVVVPYVYRDHETLTDPTTGQIKQVERQQRGNLYWIPSQLKLNAQASTESRRRGIYQAELYQTDQDWQGHFELPANWGLSSTQGYSFEPAYLAFGIADPRGLRQPKLDWQSQPLSLTSGTGLAGWKQGIRAQLPARDIGKASRAEFRLSLGLQGMQRWAVIPTGQETQVQLNADWPHPHFDGQFLPLRHQISDQGFKAEWQTSTLASQIDSQLDDCLDNGQCELPEFGVSWFSGINVYQQTDRTLKYAFLFIGLTFAGFLLYEALSAVKLHPVQYGLIGLGLALFFLLLLALSEHIAFWLAYLLAAGACIGLISSYLGLALHSGRLGLLMALILSLLYSVLYILLGSEDQALLLGSLLLFVCLSLIMLLTSRVNWQQQLSIDSYWWQRNKSSIDELE